MKIILAGIVFGCLSKVIKSHGREGGDCFKLGVWKFPKPEQFFSKIVKFSIRATVVSLD